MPGFLCIFLDGFLKFIQIGAVPGILPWEKPVAQILG